LFAHAAPARHEAVTRVENVDEYIVVHSSTTVPAPEARSASLVAPAPLVTEPATTVAITEAPAPDTSAPAPTRQAAPPATASAPQHSDDSSSSVPQHRTRPAWQPTSTTSPSDHEREHEDDSRPHTTQPGDD
jgi:hypothetical protein